MSTKTLGKKEFIEAIEKMTVLELAELVKALEEKFGVKAMAGMPVAVPTASKEQASADTEEKTEFSALLTGVGDKKIQVIKVIREITSLGLKEAKELVETTPKAIKEGVSKEQAEEIKKKLSECGATVEIK